MRPPARPARQHGDDVLTSYRYLRLAMVLLVLLLVVGVGLQVWATAPRCYLGSFSAYYYTSAHAVFVAALAALGAGLVIYRGNTDIEDVLLNFSGVMAFVIAFVPAPYDDTCHGVGTVVGPTGLGDQIGTSIRALLLVGAVTLGVARLVNPAGFDVARWTWPARVSGVCAGVTVLGLVGFFVGWRDAFERLGHTVAAVAMFVGFGAVVGANALDYARTRHPAASTPRGAARNRYAGVAYAMALTAVVGVPLALWQVFVHALFWLELALIAEFAAFWVLQTRELWNVVDRTELRRPPCRPGT